MKLHWFSPLPPAMTDVGHYTARVLPHLARLADVTLWTDQAEWDPALESLARVRTFLPDRVPWAELNRGDATFFHFGNNARFHRGIWEVSRHHPGVVVLHDVRLNDFFAGVFRSMWAGREAYLGLMGRCFGAEGRADGERWWRGQADPAHMTEAYPMTGFAMEGALAGLVHSPFAAGVLARFFPGPVAVAPLPFAASPRRDGRADRRAAGAGEPRRLVMFGYIGLNRRLDPILSAIASLPERDRFRLDVYGEVWDPEHLAARCRDLGLSDRVSYHGFVPEPELDAALDRAGLAFNLRFPTMGEASASQLRIWDHALPSLVTRVGTYADLPPSAVAFVDPAREVEDIQAHLRAFLSDPDAFAGMGEEGRRTLERDHAIDAYARTLVAIAEDVPYLLRSTAAKRLAGRVGGEIGRWCGPGACATLSERVAGELRGLAGEPRSGRPRAGPVTEGRTRAVDDVVQPV